jgi:hypothetical protein
MQKINGVFFTGGDSVLWNQDRTELSPFSQKAKFIID